MTLYFYFYDKQTGDITLNECEVTEKSNEFLPANRFPRYYYESYFFPKSELHRLIEGTYTLSYVSDKKCDEEVIQVIKEHFKEKEVQLLSSVDKYRKASKKFDVWVKKSKGFIQQC